MNKHGDPVFQGIPAGEPYWVIAAGVVPDTVSYFHGTDLSGFGVSVWLSTRDHQLTAHVLGGRTEKMPVWMALDQPAFATQWSDGQRDGISRDVRLNLRSCVELWLDSIATALVAWDAVSAPTKPWPDNSARGYATL
jgi:hypothetical protein